MANIIEEDGNFQLIMRGQPYKKMICSNNAFYINTVTGAYCGQCVILYKYDNGDGTYTYDEDVYELVMTIQI